MSLCIENVWEWMNLFEKSRLGKGGDEWYNVGDYRKSLVERCIEK